MAQELHSLMSEYGNAESILTVLRITRTTDSIAPLFSVPSFTFGKSMGKVLIFYEKRLTCATTIQLQSPPSGIS